MQPNSNSYLILIPYRLSINYSKMIWILTRISLNADSGRKLASEPTCTRATDDSFPPENNKSGTSLFNHFSVSDDKAGTKGRLPRREGWLVGYTRRSSSWNTTPTGRFVGPLAGHHMVGPAGDVHTRNFGVRLANGEPTRRRMTEFLRKHVGLLFYVGLGLGFLILDVGLFVGPFSPHPTNPKQNLCISPCHPTICAN